MGYPSCFHFISRGAAPPFPIWENLTLFSLQTRLHVTPPLLLHYGSVYTRRSSPCGASHLSGEAGTLDCLWPFFYLVLITASVECHHLASSRFNMVSFMMVCTGYDFPHKVTMKIIISNFPFVAFCKYLLLILQPGFPVAATPSEVPAASAGRRQSYRSRIASRMPIRRHHPGA